MNTPEDRLRAAMRALAESVDHGSAPPLRLPPPQPRAASRRSHWRPFRAGEGWLVPATSAAAVLALLGGLWGLSRAVLLPPGGTQAASAATQGAPSPYFAAPSSRDSRPAIPGAVMVRATAGGTLLTVVRPPASGQFIRFTPNGDERAWVLAAELPSTLRDLGPFRPGAAEPAWQLRFYWLTYSMSSRRAHLTPLPTQPIMIGDQTSLTGLSLSPDSSRLAVTLASGQTSNVETVATGWARTWDDRPAPCVAQRSPAQSSGNGECGQAV